MMVALMLASLGMFIKSIVAMVMSRPDAARNFNDDVPIDLDSGLNLFDEEGDPFLHNHAGMHPYAADD